MAWSLDGIAAWQRGCWTASQCGDVATYVVSRKLHRLKRSGNVLGHTELESGVKVAKRTGLSPQLR